MGDRYYTPNTVTFPAEDYYSNCLLVTWVLTNIHLSARMAFSNK